MFEFRWLVPPYPRVLNFQTFYEMKEDFNHVYGLSLEGLNPLVLTNKMITNVKWLSVYKVTKVKDKVKIKADKSSTLLLNSCSY